MSGDDYFRVPDAVTEGGVRGALDRGEKFIPLTSLLYSVSDASSNLGRADRIHLFVMLCGGGTKFDSDAIVDVQFELDGTQLLANVQLVNRSTEVHCNVVLGDGQ